MATTILYTNSDQIRGYVGLDETDISETLIANMLLEDQMLVELDTLYPTHIADSTDTAILRKLRIWCTIFGAIAVIGAARLAIEQKYQANTDQMVRFDIDFDKLLESLKARLNKAAEDLNPTFGLETVPQLFGSAGSYYDTVTGEEVST